MANFDSTVKFSKMHGAGNDYIYIDATEAIPSDLNWLSRCMSDRHCGIGSDGLVAIMKSDIADFRMRMFNADGSEAQMCGNASRCIGKFVFEKGLTSKSIITLETLAGIKTLHLHVENGKVKTVTVDMGEPVLSPELIPVKSAPDMMISENVSLEGEIFKITAVSMGNPHGVIFTNEITDDLVLCKGRKLEVHDIWPEKANIEFAKIINRNEIEMRVWERGTGETLACGTGACATVVAAVLNNLADRSVKVHLLGGDLSIKWDDKTNRVYMTGGATLVCDGTFELSSICDNKFLQQNKI